MSKEVLELLESQRVINQGIINLLESMLGILVDISTDIALLKLLAEEKEKEIKCD